MTRTSHPEISITGSDLRVSVVCFRWFSGMLETVLTPDSELPSSIPSAEESLDSAAERIVASIFDSPAAYMEQLYTYSPSVGPCRETLVTYFALFGPDAAGSLPWISVQGLSALSTNDATVLEYATVRLRSKLEYTSIAFHMLPERFTLAEVQQAYETILNARLDRRNFRRRMTTGGMIKDTGEKRREGPHRPAALYRFSGLPDRSTYLTPTSDTETDKAGT